MGVHVPPPVVDPDGPLQLLVSALDYDPHRGRIAVGRLVRGRLVRGQLVRCLGAATGESALAAPALKLTELFLFQGLGRQAPRAVDDHSCRERRRPVPPTLCDMGAL